MTQYRPILDEDNVLKRGVHVAIRGSDLCGLSGKFYDELHGGKNSSQIRGYVLENLKMTPLANEDWRY